MITKQGAIVKLKLLPHTAAPLVYFKLDDTNCLIHRHALNFMAEVDVGSRVVVAGEYNQRQQFVAQHYTVLGKTKIMIDFDFVNQQYQRAYQKGRN